MRWPAVMNSVIDCNIGDDGLIWNVGSMPELTRRIDSTMNLLMACSTGPWAVFSAQNAIMRFHSGRSPFMCEYHIKVAHKAPPDVPLMPTKSNSRSSCASHSVFSAPAVNAVWLPPPWQAIAIFSLAMNTSFDESGPHCSALSAAEP